MDVSDIFYFFLLGEGEGESEALGGWGIGFLLKIPGGGGEAGRGRGAGRSAANWGIWGGGLNVFFWGPKCPPRLPPPALKLLLDVNISEFIG